MMRNILSNSRVTLPKSSERRPWPIRRVMSICQSLSCAWTYPSAKNRSCSFCASMRGTPYSSRVISTGWTMPGTVSEPAVSGNDFRIWERTKSTPATSVATRTPRTPRTTFFRADKNKLRRLEQNTKSVPSVAGRTSIYSNVFRLAINSDRRRSGQRCWSLHPQAVEDFRCSCSGRSSTIRGRTRGRASCLRSEEGRDRQ